MNAEIRAAQMPFHNIDHLRHKEFQYLSISRRLDKTVDRVEEPECCIGGVI